MNSARKNILRYTILIMLIGAGLGIAWLIPRGLALYYQVRGGKLLEEVMAVHSPDNPAAFACTLVPVREDRQIKQLDKAYVALRKAEDLNPRLAQTALLLGRVYCLLGKSHGAVEAYKTYTSLRPENPLGYLELGFASMNSGDTNSALQAWKFANATAKDFLAQSVSLHQISKIGEVSKFYSWAELIAGEVFDNFTDLSGEQQFFVFESFYTTDRWQLCSWCANVDGQFRSNHGILEISFRNTTKQGDEYNIYSPLNVRIDGSNTILLRIKGNPGTLLTIEDVVDGVRSRPISNLPVNKEWTIVEVPIKGKFLTEFLIGSIESGSLPPSDQGSMQIDWIALNK